MLKWTERLEVNKICVLNLSGCNQNETFLLSTGCRMRYLLNATNVPPGVYFTNLFLMTTVTKSKTILKLKFY